MRTLSQFLRDETGATAVEYGFIIAFVALAILASVTALGTKLRGTFNEVSGNLT